MNLEERREKLWVEAETTAVTNSTFASAFAANKPQNGEVQVAMPVPKHFGVLPGLFDDPQPCCCEHCTCAEPAEQGEPCRACRNGNHFEAEEVG